MTPANTRSLPEIANWPTLLIRPLSGWTVSVPSVEASEMRITFGLAVPMAPSMLTSFVPVRLMVPALPVLSMKAVFSSVRLTWPGALGSRIGVPSPALSVTLRSAWIRPPTVRLRLEVMVTSLPVPRARTSPCSQPSRPALKLIEPSRVSSTPLAANSMSRPSAELPA